MTPEPCDGVVPIAADKGSPGVQDVAARAAIQKIMLKEELPPFRMSSPWPPHSGVVVVAAVERRRCRHRPAGGRRRRPDQLVGPIVAGQEIVAVEATRQVVAEAAAQLVVVPSDSYRRVVTAFAVDLVERTGPAVSRSVEPPDRVVVLAAVDGVVAVTPDEAVPAGPAIDQVIPAEPFRRRAPRFR